MFWTRLKHTHKCIIPFTYDLETWFKFILYFLTTSMHTLWIKYKPFRALEERKFDL